MQTPIPTLDDVHKSIDQLVADLPNQTVQESRKNANTIYADMPRRSTRGSTPVPTCILGMTKDGHVAYIGGGIDPMIFFFPPEDAKKMLESRIQDSEIDSREEEFRLCGLKFSERHLKLPPEEYSRMENDPVHHYTALLQRLKTLQEERAA